jgi:hypothetical protein
MRAASGSEWTLGTSQPIVDEFSDECRDLRVRRDAADNIASHLSSSVNGLWLRARLVAERKNQLADDPQLRGGRAHLLAQLVEFLERANFRSRKPNAANHGGEYANLTSAYPASKLVVSTKRL